MIIISSNGNIWIRNTLNIWLDGVNAFEPTFSKNQSKDNKFSATDPILCKGIIKLLIVFGYLILNDNVTPTSWM